MSGLQLVFHRETAGGPKLAENAAGMEPSLYDKLNNTFTLPVFTATLTDTRTPNTGGRSNEAFEETDDIGSDSHRKREISDGPIQTHMFAIWPEDAEVSLGEKRETPTVKNWLRRHFPQYSFSATGDILDDKLTHVTLETLTKPEYIPITAMKKSRFGMWRAKYGLFVLWIIYAIWATVGVFLSANKRGHLFWIAYWIICYGTVICLAVAQWDVVKKCIPECLKLSRDHAIWFASTASMICAFFCCYYTVTEYMEEKNDHRSSPLIIDSPLTTQPNNGTVISFFMVIFLLMFLTVKFLNSRRRAAANARYTEIQSMGFEFQEL